VPESTRTRFGPVEGITADDWDSNLRHELDVVLWPVKQAWPHLKGSHRGAVVLVGSTAGLTGSMTEQRVAHSVIKGGVVAMSRQMAARAGSASV
jgi:NAD(P)-dependent dehydrogenase (short-subunit alcohol dehydrogenase family)